MESFSKNTQKLLEAYQCAEETGYQVYLRVAKREKNGANKKLLEQIALDEKSHAATWKRYTQKEIGPSIIRVWWYSLLSVFAGYTFVLKLMERSEYVASAAYHKLIEEIPEALSIMEQEQEHENTLNALLDEERLRYVGDIVLGLNDALVELTGTIAGLTFALANTRLVALSGIITGISATLSMATSNYLATQAEENPHALKSSVYTGCAYLVTVILLVLPYLLFSDSTYILALITMIATAILIIFCFNYYLSVAKSLPFWRQFSKMAAISIGVAAFSFVIGLAAKHLLGVDL